MFLHVPSVELAAFRVAERVRSGGHDVPSADIRRRYGRGIRNSFGPYAAVFDACTVIDNSSPDPRIVAFHDGSDLCIVEPSTFAAMRKGAGSP
ncbi:MAG: hypothetical protein AB2L07_00455 [Thermoanaerobaculaceae bacterium]